MVVAGIAFIAVNAFMTWWAWRRTAWFSPAALWSLYGTLNLIVLLAVIQSGLHLPLAQLGPMPSIRLEDHFIAVCWIFTALGLIGPLAAAGLPPGGGGRAALGAVFRRFYASRPAFAYAALIFALTAAHLAMIDKETLWLNSEYLTLSDAQRNGLGGGFGSLLNNAVRPLALPAFLLIAFKPAGRHDLKSLMLAFACAYALTFSLAVYSRFAMVYIFVFMLGVVFARRDRATLAGLLLPPALGAAAFGAFMIAIIGRQYELQGVGSLPEVAATLDTTLVELLISKFFTLSFDGAMNLANAMRLDPDYRFEYALLSFSPFPSAIDGFNAIQERLSFRINRYVPVGAFSEAWHFGLLWFGLFYVVAALVVRQMTVGFFRHRDMATITLYPVFLICLFKLQAYSLRTSLRLFIMIAAISLISCWLARVRRAREEAAAEAEAARDGQDGHGDGGGDGDGFDGADRADPAPAGPRRGGGRDGPRRGGGLQPAE